MACENRIYNFKPQRHGDTSFKKRFKITQATAQWDLVMKIKGALAQKTVTTGNGLTRIDDQTWEYTQHTEDLPAGIYDYVLCYTINGNVERTLVSGKMEILKHI